MRNEQACELAPSLFTSCVLKIGMPRSRSFSRSRSQDYEVIVWAVAHAMYIGNLPGYTELGTSLITSCMLKIGMFRLGTIKVKVMFKVNVI